MIFLKPIEKYPKLKKPLVLIMFFLLLVGIGASLYLVNQRQDLRQRAGGGLITAKVLMMQYGYLLSASELRDLGSAMSSLIHTATKTDISLDVTVANNVMPPQLSKDQFDKLRNDPRFTKISDADLVFWRYYDSLDDHSNFHRNLANAQGNGQGYDLVSIVSNYQLPNPGYAWDYSSGRFITVVNPYYFEPFENKVIQPIAEVHNTAIHELGHALGANHPCNRCYPDDPESDNPYQWGDGSDDWNESKRKECCDKCQWKDDIMSYCSGHVSDYSKAYSSCTVRRLESGQYRGGWGGVDCNEGTEYVIGKEPEVPKDIPANTDCNLDKTDCVQAQKQGLCYWYKGYLGEFPYCKKGEAGVSCGVESHCQPHDGVTQQICYFDTYCANPGDLGFDAPCQTPPQCPYGSTCKGTPLTCARTISPTITPTPEEPKDTNTCVSTGGLDYDCALKSSGGCSSLTGRWTESNVSEISCGDDSKVCCWDMGPQKTLSSCAEKFAGSICRPYYKCSSEFEINDPTGTTCDDATGDNICCGPKVDYGTTYNCLDKNCDMSYQTCVGSSDGNSLGSFCLGKNVGGNNAYCGLPDGKGANNESCRSSYCNPSTLRCQDKPKPPTPPPPLPPTATPTPAAPAIPSISVTTCVNNDPGTVIFNWSREKSGYNYEIRWGTNYSEKITVGDRSTSDPISGFTTGVSVPYQIRAYAGSNIGPYKSDSFWLANSCSTSGSQCPGGISNCANDTGSNYSCTGKKIYQSDGTYDNWCKNNGGGGSREYCWRCDASSTLTCDFNNNGSYDDGDMIAWTQSYKAGNSSSDCNGDGKSDIFDFNLWYEKSKSQ